MNSILTTCYGVYNLDDRGCNEKLPISIWPIKAAADAQLGGNYYKGVSAVNILKIEDINYICEKEIDKTMFKGKIKSFVPCVCYYEHIYENGWDQSLYHSDEKVVLKLLRDSKTHSIRSVIMFYDGEKYFLLKSDIPVTVEKVTMSRELAINHAMSKLTDEEKGLLGLK